MTTRLSTRAHLLVALCLAVVSLTAIGTALFAGNGDPPLDRYEDQIKSYESRDAAKHSQPPTVFVGSSTFARWKSLENVFQRYHALNRGFGGSTIPEITHYALRIVCKYRPQNIVFYAGTNDIAEAHHSGRRVFQDFAEFARLIHVQLPGTHIFFVSMSVAPSRVDYIAEYEEGNRLIRDYSKRDPLIHYVDVTAVMHDERGQLREEFFDKEDHLHMSDAGYAAWVPIIRQALEDHRLTFADSPAN